ncbi:MAG: ankyrin repeat domain-containing protein [Pseudomonadales bacterium]|jgi:ankyrin repeat protein|nr:ankyrin repeat domain-containing protein [Pseudomonadales bacterium]
MKAAAVTESELWAAARSGNNAVLVTILEQDLAVDARQPDGTSALHWAVLGGHLAAVNTLLAAGADANASDRYGTTPLSLAALNGDAAVAAALLQAGANPNVLDAAHESVLMTAARTGVVEVVDLLLEHGALAGYVEPHYGLSALMLAALENHPEVVTRLTRLGARVNQRTRIGPEQPFIIPCKGGCGSEGVGINRGGVPDRGERPEIDGGMTPLLYAARDGRLEVAQALLAAGADLEQTEANEITPLLMALLNGQVEVAQFFLDHGAQVNVADFYGRTPLFAAVEYRNLDMNNNDDPNPVHNGVAREKLFPVIERLLQAGAKVNARTREYPPSRRWIHARNDITWVDMTGQTPFVRAAFSGDVEAMRLLLEHGADPFITTYGGTSALMAAAGLNWRETQSYSVSAAALLEAVNLCIELGLDVNASNSMGLTALLGAANRGSNDIIEVLVAHGARLDIQDAEGRTPLQWAQGVFLGDLGAQPKPETVTLLRQLGAE